MGEMVAMAGLSGRTVDGMKAEVRGGSMMVVVVVVVVVVTTRPYC